MVDLGDQRILIGDVLDRLRELPDGSVDCVVTSPPYWGLRDYGADGQIGLEESPDVWCARLVDVFRECRRVLADHGTLWVNCGDAYGSGTTGRNDAGRDTPGGRGGSINGGERTHINGSSGTKPKDLIGLPWMLAFALRADGWWLRSEIIWAKPNPMPESVRDRPTKGHEQIFLLSKRPRYYYDADAIRDAVTSDRAPSRKAKHSGAGHLALRPNGTPYDGEGTSRNARTVWSIATQPFPEAHFATFPEELPRRCIAAGCPERVCTECGQPSARIVDGGWSDCGHGAWRTGVVLDPFCGSGTTLQVARRLNRHGIGTELNPEYAEIAARRIGREPKPQGVQMEVTPCN